jgi:putative transposase
MKRVSYDPAIKHITRHGLLQDILTKEQIGLIPSSNISRWRQESDDKYSFCEINDILKQEIELIKRLNQSSKIKKINQRYFKLADTFHEVICNVKGIKSHIKEQKQSIVDAIEQVKNIIPINKALKVFNISRSTFENYKSILIHKCESSYFIWCTKRLPNQLLPVEVKPIKTYMNDHDFDDLSDDWDIVSIDATTINLIDVSGGNGGTDRLTFKKN